MAEISKITTPNGSSYDLKDAAARLGLASHTHSSIVCPNGSHALELANSGAASITGMGAVTAHDATYNLSPLGDVLSGVTVTVRWSLNPSSPYDGEVVGSSGIADPSYSGGTILSGGDYFGEIASLTDAGTLTAMFFISALSQVTPPTVPSVSDVAGPVTVQTDSNLVTSLSSSSTDSQYPSAKCVYDGLADKADSNDAILTQAYRKVLAGYTCDPSTYSGQPYSGAVTVGLTPVGYAPYVDGNVFGDPKELAEGQETLTWTAQQDWGGTVDLVVTFTWSDDTSVLRGYMLGDQSDKLLQPAGDYATSSQLSGKEDAFTTLGVSKGGTGLQSLTSGSYLVGNGTSSVSLKTPAQVLSDIGAAASSHTHTGSQITDLSDAVASAMSISTVQSFQVLDWNVTLTAADKEALVAHDPGYADNDFAMSLTDNGDTSWNLVLGSVGVGLLLEDSQDSSKLNWLQGDPAFPASQGDLIVTITSYSHPAYVIGSAPERFARAEDLWSYVDSGGGGGGGSQELRYAIVTPTVTTSTTDSSNDTLSATLQDRAVNIVTAGSGIDYVNLTFPAQTQGYARDFFVRLVLTGSSVPAVSFSEPGGGDVEFDVDDDSWAEIDLGVNLLMFTETSQPSGSNS